jgi:hypothetical protein
MAGLFVMAVAAIGTSSFALAPVISSLPDVIIANDRPVTTANQYVYPDAFNLNNAAMDNDVASPNFMWSFGGGFDMGTRQRYLINTNKSIYTTTAGTTFNADLTTPGVYEIGRVTTGANAHPGGALNGTLGCTSAGVVYDDDIIAPYTFTGSALTGIGARVDDSNVRTITFRDAVLSPIGKLTTDLTGTAQGTVIASSAVTLFASDASTDGALYSSKTFMVYTKYGSSGASYSGLSGAALATGVQGKGGRNATSTGGVYTYNPATDGKTWTTASLGGARFPAASTDSGNGLCLAGPTSSGAWTTAQTAGYYGLWLGANNYFSLTANTVYRIRLNVDAASTQTPALQAGKVPFWDILVDNVDNKYSTDFLNVDQNGKDNSLANENRFDVWFCPPQINSLSWNGATTSVVPVTSSGTVVAFNTVLNTNNSLGLQLVVSSVGAGTYYGSTGAYYTSTGTYYNGTSTGSYYMGIATSGNVKSTYSLITSVGAVYQTAEFKPTDPTLIVGVVSTSGATIYPSSNGAAYIDSGAFGTTHAATNGFRLGFRMLDVHNSGLSAETWYGNICLKNYSVTAVPIAQLDSTAQALWPQSAAEGQANNGAFIVHSFIGPSGGALNNAGDRQVLNVTKYTGSGTALVITPNLANTNSDPDVNGIGDLSLNNAWNIEIVSVYPGYPNNGVSSDPAFADPLSNDLAVTNGWPIKWVSNQLLRGTVTVAAPTAAAQNYPIDALMIAWESPTWEIFQDSMALYAQANNPSGMPAYGADTDYVSFFYTHLKSSYTSSALASGGGKNTDAQRLRMTWTALLSPNIQSGGPTVSTNNNSGVTLRAFKIDLVSPPINMP